MESRLGEDCRRGERRPVADKSWRKENWRVVVSRRDKPLGAVEL
jgi:hypothetical protein